MIQLLNTIGTVLLLFVCVVALWPLWISLLEAWRRILGDRRHFVLIAIFTIVSFGIPKANAQTSLPDAPSTVQLAFSRTFNVTTNAIALPGNKQTLPGSLIGGTIAVTRNFSLRQTNIISAAVQAYLGGFEYAIPKLSRLVNNISPAINGNQLQFYVTGSFGIDETATSSRHYAGLVGFGARYDPTNSGNFSVSLFEVQAARLPGYANGVVPVISTGFTFHP